jgi:hypothetical protein
VSLARLEGLRKLRLNYFHFNYFFELVDLICSFESLVDISLDSVFWGEDGTPERHSPPRNLQAVHLGDTDKERIFEWILSSASSLLSSIKTVNLRHINPSQMPTLRQFLRAVGPSLQELRLSFFNFDWTHKSPGASHLVIHTPGALTNIDSSLIDRHPCRRYALSQPTSFDRD